MSISGQERQVLQSQAGFYIGTIDSDGDPLSRDSEEYWPTKSLADVALSSGKWTLRDDS